MKITHLIILTLICNSLLSQESYWEYYSECNKALNFIEEGLPVKSIKPFEKAFSLVSYPLFKDLIHAAESEHALGHHDKAKAYWLKAASVSDREIVLPDGVKEIEVYNNIDQELQHQLATFKSSLNHTYIKSIDSLGKIDLAIRKTGKVIYTDGVNNDSTNTLTLLNLINEYGWPSVRKVGKDAYFKARVILLHADFDRRNKLLHDLTYSAVKNGEMMAFEYAEIVDRRQMNLGLPFLYHQTPFLYNDLSVKEKAAINKNRTDIGLRCVEKGMSWEWLPNGDLYFKNIQ